MSNKTTPAWAPPNIDMTVIAALQKDIDWSGLQGVINLFEKPATVTAGQKSLTDQQIALIDGQRRINGGLLKAINLILDSLDTAEASAATKDKVGAAKDLLKGLLGEVPPGCENRRGL